MPGEQPPRGALFGGEGFDIWPLMAQMGVMNKISSGSTSVDLIIALALPLFFSWLGGVLAKLWASMEKRRRLAGYTRRIEHTVIKSNFWWAEADDQDEEHAPNSVLQRAILMYINKTFPEKTLQWQAAEVTTRKINSAKPRNRNSHCSNSDSSSTNDHDIDDDEDDGDVPVFSYLIQPPENEYVKITSYIELQRETAVRNNENANRQTQSKEQTTIFELRCKHANGARHVDAFIKQAIQFYNQKLRENIDHARYLYVPTLTSLTATNTAGGNSGGRDADKSIYRRYRLGDNRTFESFFHPEKESVLALVRAFQAGAGKFAIPGYPKKLGFLLHGPPGTGKTSFIKALAHYTGRHVVSIPLAKIKTNQDLMDLMHEQRVELHGGSDTTAPTKLPFNKVIYVLEDVDAASSLVHRRTPAEPSQSITRSTITGPESTFAALPAPTCTTNDSSGIPATTTPPQFDTTPDVGTGASSPTLEPGISTATVAGGVGVCVCVGGVGGGAQQGTAQRQTSTPPSALEMQLLLTQLQLQEMQTIAAAQAESTSAGVEVVGGGCGPAVPWTGSKEKADWYKDLVKPSVKEDALNLAGLLNVLDGVVDTPDRILVMTTNHPERLDPALIRPGRINKKIYLGQLRFEQAMEMISHYFLKDHTTPTSPATAATTLAASDTVAKHEVVVAGGWSVDRLGGVMREVWVDDIMTPAEMECMCAEYEDITELIVAVGQACAKGRKT